MLPPTRMRRPSAWSWGLTASRSRHAGCWACRAKCWARPVTPARRKHGRSRLMTSGSCSTALADLTRSRSRLARGSRRLVSKRPSIPRSSACVTPASLMADIQTAAAEPIAMQGGESFAAALAEAEAAVPGEPVEERLIQLGVGESLVKDLIETAATVALPVMSPQASLRDAVRLVLRLMIPMASELPSRNVAVAVVGPGGSGKSACCAGLLERGRESNSANVACATVSVDRRSGEHLMSLGSQIRVRCRYSTQTCRRYCARHARKGSCCSTCLPSRRPIGARSSRRRRCWTSLGRPRHDRVAGNTGRQAGCADAAPDASTRRKCDGDHACR